MGNSIFRNQRLSSISRGLQRFGNSVAHAKRQRFGVPVLLRVSVPQDNFGFGRVQKTKSPFDRTRSTLWRGQSIARFFISEVYAARALFCSRLNWSEGVRHDVLDRGFVLFFFCLRFRNRKQCESRRTVTLTVAVAGRSVTACLNVCPASVIDYSRTLRGTNARRKHDAARTFRRASTRDRGACALQLRRKPVYSAFG